MSEVYLTGHAALVDESLGAPELELAIQVIIGALNRDRYTQPGDVDGLYLPKQRPWADQGFFASLLASRLGFDTAEQLEIYTGGTSGGNVFHSAVRAIKSGRIETAVVAAVERCSIIESAEYLSHLLRIFDQEFQSPAGPTVPGIYAQSLQRYCHEFDVDREAIAAISAKNRSNGATNPTMLCPDAKSIDNILNSPPIAEPLRLLDCPEPCDGAGAIVLSAHQDAADIPIRIAGIGSSHASQHMVGTNQTSLAQFPVLGNASTEALGEASMGVGDIDVFEPYAPFPHVEAIFTEEIGLYDRGAGAKACLQGDTKPEGTHPVSPSGGCLGRGHPAMVSPILNYIEAAHQLRGTAPNQVPTAQTALTTSEHGHVDGVTATVLEGPQ